MFNGVSLRIISPPRVDFSEGRFIADVIITNVIITNVKLPGGIDGWLIAERCRDRNRVGLKQWRAAREWRLRSKAAAEARAAPSRLRRR